MLITVEQLDYFYLNRCPSTKGPNTDGLLIIIQIDHKDSLDLDALEIFIMCLKMSAFVSPLDNDRQMQGLENTVSYSVAENSSTISNINSLDKLITNKLGKTP